MTHTFNPSAREAEAGGSLWIEGQPGLHSEFRDSQGYLVNLVSRGERETETDTETETERRESQRQRDDEKVYTALTEDLSLISSININRAVKRSYCSYKGTSFSSFYF